MGYDERVGTEGIAGFDGIDLSRSELALEPQFSPDLMNVDLHPYGTLKKRSGYEVQSTVGTLGTGYTLALGRTLDRVTYYYAHRGAGIFRASSVAGTWDDVADDAGITIDSSVRMNMVQGLHLGSAAMLLSNGAQKPLIATMDEDTASDLIVWPTGVYGDGTADSGTKGYPAVWEDDWPTHLAIINTGLGASAQRCVAWGFEGEPDRIDYSELGVLTNFLQSEVDTAPTLEQDVAEIELDGGSFFAGEGDGDDIVDVLGMFGYLIVMKKRRIYVYVGDPAQETFTIHSVIEAGCVSRRSVVKVGTDVLFWSRTGPRSLAFIRERGDISPGTMAWPVQPITRDATDGNRDEIVAVHDMENNRVIWFFPSGGVSTNNRAAIFYYDRPRWTQYNAAFTEIADAETVSSIESANQQSYAIRYDGKVVQLGTGVYDDEADIDAYYITAWINFGNISDASRTLWLDILFGDEGSDGLLIQRQLDLQAEWADVSDPLKSYGGSGARWDDVNWDEFLWDDAGRGYSRYDMNALFNLLRLKFSSSDPYPFTILGYRVEARRKGARA